MIFWLMPVKVLRMLRLPQAHAALLPLAAALALGGSAVVRAGAGDTLSSAPFGTTADGRPVELYTLRNAHGMQVRIATYGGTVTSLTAPDRAGHYADVVLGYDDLAGYLKGSAYLGALIGRYANRIAHGTFTLGGKRYTVTRNDGDNTLHGGAVGFDKVLWTVVAARVTSRGPQLSLSYLSPDGESGFPGHLKVGAVYTLMDDDTLRLEYRATSDRDTVVSFTQHNYFNLRGSGDVLGHVVQINAGRFTPVDSNLIPTGELRAVAGTPFDFRQPTAVAARIADPDEQLRLGKGYDHNFVIDAGTAALRPVASVYEPTTGRVLEVLATEPGLQFYTGNHLDGFTGKGGTVYRQRTGLCLEPQHFPDSPNHPDFPSTLLRAHQPYHSTIVWRFRAR
jgi:aldose 1-epimerase